MCKLAGRVHNQKTKKSLKYVPQQVYFQDRMAALGYSISQRKGRKKTFILEAKAKLDPKMESLTIIIS